MSCANSNLDRDQTFTVHDFGPRGFVGNVKVNLTHGLQPGAMISAVVLTDTAMNFAVYDTNKQITFSFGARVAQNQLAFNAQANGAWGTELHAEKNPWLKGVRATVCLLYDVDGYRVFVNGEAVMVFMHRSKNTHPDYVDITGGQVFKVIYQTTMNIIP